MHEPQPAYVLRRSGPGADRLVTDQLAPCAGRVERQILRIALAFTVPAATALRGDALACRVKQGRRVGCGMPVGLPGALQSRWLNQPAGHERRVLVRSVAQTRSPRSPPTPATACDR